MCNNCLSDLRTCAKNSQIKSNCACILPWHAASNILLHAQENEKLTEMKNISNKALRYSVLELDGKVETENKCATQYMARAGWHKALNITRQKLNEGRMDG
jgi:hypothetical protein